MPSDLLLTVCVIVAFFGWILVSGGSDRPPLHAATHSGVTLCDGTHCVALRRPAVHELPREWRWELKRYAFEQMYRKGAERRTPRFYSSASK